MAGGDRIGTELAGYRLLEVIGRGGASVVYLAEHLRLGRRAALKVLAPYLGDDEAFRGRFIRESRTAAGLDHPNIVPVYDAGDADGVLYLAMRYIPGSDLGKTIRASGPLEPWRTIAIVSQVAAALDAAHSEGLVHRDVKPGNVLLTRDRGTDREQAFLSDFGLTKRMASSGEGPTQSGQFVGTVDYVSPEQILGEAVDGRTDVYSLGCVLFHCLRGAPPFLRPNDVGTIYAHVHEPPPTLTASGSSRIDDVVSRALAKDRDHRYGTCSDLVEAAHSAIEAEPDALRELSEYPGPRPRPATEEPPTTVVARDATAVAPATVRRAARRRGRLGWIGAVGALSLGAVVLSSVLASPEDPAGSASPSTRPPPSSTPERNRTEYFWIEEGDWLVEPIVGENEIMNAAIATTDGGLIGVGHADPSPFDEDAAVWSSPNGRRWRRIDADPLRAPGSQRLVDVAPFAGGYVAIGYSGDDAAVWTTDSSERGWHLVQVLEETGYQVMREIVVMDGSLLVVGRNVVGDDSDAASWVSEDGSAWARVPDEALEGPGTQSMWTTIEIEGVVFGLGAAAGESGFTDPAVWRLGEDGWSSVEVGLGAAGAQEIRDVAIGDDGTVVAVGIDGKEGASDVAIWTSSDPSLETWRPAEGRFEVPNDQQLLSVVATDTGFVAMGWTEAGPRDHDGLIWTSVDGVHWRRPPRDDAVLQLGGDENQEVRSLVAFGTKLVGVGVSGTDEEKAEIWVGTPR